MQDTGMEAYKHFAFGRSSSALHWLHHLTLLGLLPWYYKYQKVGMACAYDYFALHQTDHAFQILTGLQHVAYNLN